MIANEFMNNSDRNWSNLFGEFTTDETAWYGQWDTYSPKQQLIRSKQVIRSFRSNNDNTVITHTNRYLDADGYVADETTWQIDRETCNQPDGVSHPAADSMRTLSFGSGALAWMSQRLTPHNACGAELFLGDHEWRTSVAIVYGENGQLSHITHIREHRGCFSNELLTETSTTSGSWIGKERSMTPDLNILPEEDIQVSFDQISDHHVIVFLPGNMLVLFPERVDGQPIQLAVGQRTASHQLKYLAAHYDAAGAFTSLVSATLKPYE